MTDRKTILTKLAIGYLVLFCIHFIPIEGYVVRYLKFSAMTIAPLLYLMYAPKISKAVFWGLLYYAAIFFSFFMRDWQDFRITSVIFSGMFLCMYMLFYNLVYAGAFTADIFLKTLRYLILAYTICLVLQQMCCLMGIHYMPLINLVNPMASQLTKLNSLSIEPSSAARTLACLMFALIKMTEIKLGRIPSVRELYGMYHREILGWFWCMLTMGSGTAILCIFLLSLYFFKKKYAVTAAFLLMFFLTVLPALHLKQVDRVLKVAEAVQTLDNEEIMEADGSAATRILPWVNTIHHFDITSFKIWFGNGLKTQEENQATIYSEENMIGCISSFGLLAYLASLGLTFGCAIRKFWSIPCLMHFIGVGGGVSNIAYGWGLLMIWTVLFYFDASRDRVHSHYFC